MAKKKKKGPPKSQNSTPTATPSKQELEKDEPDEICEYLELKLRRPATSKSSSSKSPTAAPPNVTLNENDAKSLGLGPRDEVLICIKGRDSTDALAGSLICQVGTHKNSLQSPSSSGRNQSNCPQGICHVQPSFVVDDLFWSESDDRTANTKTPNSTPLMTSSPTTPFKTPTPSTNRQSTPSSGFSFASGGGGEMYTSPSPATPSSKAKAVTQSTLSVLIFPLSAPLGEDLASVLCQKAEKICLQISDPEVKARLSDYKQILTKLFLVQCRGRYIHEGENVTLSFAGKSLTVRIESVEGARKADQRNQMLMELEMEALSLEDVEEPLQMEVQLWKSIRAALEQKNTAKGVLLFNIDSDTQITFSSEDKTIEKEMIDSQDPNKEQPKSYVAGLSSTVERLRSLLLTPLTRPEVFSRGALKAPRGVLLYGSSGVGKSCLARQLKVELEKEESISIRVEFVSCASLQSYSAQVGEAERRLSEIFQKASLAQRSNSIPNKRNATLIVFDDVHLICPKRSGYNPGSDRLAATLLGLLDGIGSASSASAKQLASTDNGAICSSIVILAITNNPAMLDPALRRPGRLDYEVEVPSPDDASARAEILQFQLENVGSKFPTSNFSKEELLSLGKLAKGFNGADCMLSVKEALRLALLRHRSEVELQEVSELQITLSDMRHAIRTTKPSAIKSITVEIPKVHWSSIGGMEQVKKELREAIELPISHGDLFKQLSIPPPRGILLYGPPGCSKTLMARALATEGQMNFLAVKGPELLSKWLGESERALASLFNRARMASPCIIFFDEIDSIAAKRGSSGIGSGGGRLLSQLLTELDGVNQTGGVSIGANQKNPRVVVVGATNRPDLLDSALMRPGRIDRKIYVGIPDLPSRAQIFKIGLEGKACSDSIDILKLSEDEFSGGFSGAELIAACRDAALLALEEDETGAPSIGMSHLLKALGAMQRQITPEMIEFYEQFRKNA